MILNKNKNIGKVIYIVEGDNDEVDILKNVFTKILNYSFCTYDKRTTITKLINQSNSYSRVFVIPAQFSAIARFYPTEDYFDNVYRELSKYDLDVENSAIYFIFDRDRDSNRPGMVLKNIRKYKNSRDNDYEMNGLFLISYPSIEAYYYNCNALYIDLKNGKEAKEGLENLKLQISEESLIQGVKEFIQLLVGFGICWKSECLDDFKDVNESIFNFEEDYFASNKKYRTLSLLFISLLDLGIIENE